MFICCHFDPFVKLLGNEASAMVQELHGHHPNSLLISVAKLVLGIRALRSHTN